MSDPIKNYGSRITHFINSFKKDVARPCNFDVLIKASYMPSNIGGVIENAGYYLQERIQDYAEALRFKCEAVDMPSRQLGLVEQTIYGPNLKFPISNSYDDVILRFICGDDMFEKYFFDSWLNVISVPNKAMLENYAGDVSKNINTSGVGIGTEYDFAYKDNYVCDIQITQYDVIGEISYQIKLVNAFPYVVRALPLRWNDNNDYHKLDVHFNYRYFEINDNKEPNWKGSLKKFLLEKRKT